MADTEQEVPSLPHRPDVRATYFDVYITHPNRLASAPELRRRGQSPSAFIEAAWQERLRTDYQGGPPPRARPRRKSGRAARSTQDAVSDELMQNCDSPPCADVVYRLCSRSMRHNQRGIHIRSELRTLHILVHT